MSLVEWLGGTKFALSLVSLAVGVGVHVLSAKGLTTELMTLLVTISGGYSLANAMITRKSIEAEGAATISELAEGAPPVDLSPVLTSCKEVEVALGQLANAATGLAKKEDLDGLSESLEKIAGMLANTNKLLAATVAARRS